MTALLVTNDFPPKLGGIQSYLWELWRRLPPAETVVLTRDHPGADRFDAAQAFRIIRTATRRPLLPTPMLARHIDAVARESGAGLVFLDPLFQVGVLGLRLSAAPYAIVVHGAEITLPGAFPGLRNAGRAALRGAAGVVAAGGWPARMAERIARVPLPGLVVPPGVDVERFQPLDPTARAAARRRFGLDPGRALVLGVSRLVPRKGFDVLIDAIAGLGRDVQVAIAGDGRDRSRLHARAERLGVPVRLLGRVPDDDLPALYGCADAFAMLCRDRWGGLEAEGFGIVFLEAAACGVPAVAGRSGGSHEAVVDGETGFVVPPRDVGAVRDALCSLLDDPTRCAAMGVAARRRAVEQFAYERLALRLLPLARGHVEGLEALGAASLP